jgi:hypothetical protein
VNDVLSPFYLLYTCVPVDPSQSMLMMNTSTGKRIPTMLPLASLVYDS